MLPSLFQAATNLLENLENSGKSTPRKKVISKREDYSQIDDAFSSQKWSPKYYSRLWDYFRLERQIESNPL